MNISKESREFLENLRLYLFSSGKNEEEIEEVIEELEDHLSDAEKDGKNVEDIIGQTPKEYMMQIANEMSYDFKGLLKYIPIVILGAFSYTLLGDAIRGEMKYSIIDLIGYPLIILITLFLTAVLFKYVASNKIPKTKGWFIFGIVGSIPTALFIALIFLDVSYNPPNIQFGTVGEIIGIVIPIVVFIGISVWSKTWISIILPIMLILPEALIDMTNLQEETKLILSGTVVLPCVGIYMLIILKMEKNKDKTSNG